MEKSAELFNNLWRRWRDEYLTTIQARRKWTEVRKAGDVVLLTDIGIMEESFRSADKVVRKVCVRVAGICCYTRPINELVLLISE